MIQKCHVASNFELEGITPYNFELSVHAPCGYHWITPSEVYSNNVVWAAAPLSSAGAVGLKLKFVGSVHKPIVSLTVFSRRKLASDEESKLLKNVERALGLKEDVSEFYKMAEKHPILKQAVTDLYGMRGSWGFDVFDRAIVALTSQNAPMNRTRQMINAIIGTYGETAEFDDHAIQTWPLPQTIVEVDAQELKEKGKLGYRAAYLKDLAKAVVDGACPDLEELEKMGPDQAKKVLRGLRGIGQYSAEIVSPHPGFPLDIWSVRLFTKIFMPEKSWSSLAEAMKAMREYAENEWGRWRDYVFTYIINDLENLSRKLSVKLGLTVAEVLEET